MTYWTVVQTEPRREHTACYWLQRAGFQTYLPRIETARKPQPLFPNYVIIQIVSRWYAARWTTGVHRVLMSGDQPVRLKDDIVQSLRSREINGLVRLPQIPLLKPGDRVRIIHGSFEGRIALYQGMSAHQRQRVLLELLGQFVPVELPANHIEPL
jgi:transcriptional antiterminator RfaH